MPNRILVSLSILFCMLALSPSVGAQAMNNSSGYLYVMREGETLRHVARRFYEDELAFPSIIAATNEFHQDGVGLLSIENEFDVRAGQEVWIPLDITLRLEESGDSHASVASAVWSYQGDTNPTNWGMLQSGYSVCASGMRQSPISISPGAPYATSVPAFDYNVSNLVISNNGRAIQISQDPGSSVTYNGVKYDLAQFHFHVPSEHMVDGVLASMETHFVHVSEDNRLLVIAVLYETGPEYVDTLAEIWDTLPPKGYVLHTNHQINVKRLFSADAPMYHYTGSLTTPPCTEDVDWFVVAKKEQITRRQLSELVELNGFNARPVQALNGHVFK